MPGTKNSGNRSGLPRQPGAGRKRKLIIKDRRGTGPVVWRNGDEVAVHDKHGITIATVSITLGMVILTNEEGQTLTITRAD